MGHTSRARVVRERPGEADDGDEARPPSRVMLPLRVRNRLAALIVESLHDPGARRGLEALAAARAASVAGGRGGDLPQALVDDWFDERGGELRLAVRWAEHVDALAERAARAWRVLRAQPLHPEPTPLGAVLDSAALLFDAGLYFETHELLEPHWVRAAASDREALQGLIQVAVGFQHLADGNAAGARSLLREGCVRLRRRELATLALDPFARAIARCLRGIRHLGVAAPSSFDWRGVPRFPARST